MKKIVLAAFLSVVFHVVLLLAETLAERHGLSTEIVDSVVSYPAKVFGALMPSGHGVPQLVLPFIFSLVFYAFLFWLLIFFYGRWRRKSVQNI